jgi:hypothetical protein
MIMATLNIYSYKDARLREEFPDSNYDDGSYIFLNNETNDRERGIFGFSHSSLPSNAVVSSAILYFHTDNIYVTSTFYFKRTTTNTWTETGVTWNNQPSTTSTNQASRSSVSSSDTWYTVDITDMYNDSLSESDTEIGIVASVTATLSTSSRINTRESSYTPYILVTYTTVNEPTTDWYVVDGGTGEANGYDWDNAMATVNEAMTSVTNGNTVHIAFGTYTDEPANNTLSPDADDVTVIYETADTGGGSGTATIEVN